MCHGMNGGARAKRAAVCESCGCRWAARWADCEGRSRARCAIRAEILRSLPGLWRPLWHSAALTLFSASPKSVPPPWLAFHLPLLACLCNSLLSATPAACVPASSSNSSSSSRGVWSTPSPGFARRSLPCRRCLKLPMAQPDFAPTGAPVASANDAPRSQRFAGASGHGLHKRGGRRRRLAAAFYYPSTFRFKAFGLRDVSVVLAHAASFMRGTPYHFGRNGFLCRGTRRHAHLRKVSPLQRLLSIWSRVLPATAPRHPVGCSAASGLRLCPTPLSSGQRTTRQADAVSCRTRRGKA